MGEDSTSEGEKKKEKKKTEGESSQRGSNLTKIRDGENSRKSGDKTHFGKEPE